MAALTDWVCESCGEAYSERPNDETVVGCPECGTWVAEDAA